MLKGMVAIIDHVFCLCGGVKEFVQTCNGDAVCASEVSHEWGISLFNYSDCGFVVLMCIKVDLTLGEFGKEESEGDTFSAHTFGECNKFGGRSGLRRRAGGFLSCGSDGCPSVGACDPNEDSRGGTFSENAGSKITISPETD